MGREGRRRGCFCYFFKVCRFGFFSFFGWFFSEKRIRACWEFGGMGWRVFIRGGELFGLLCFTIGIK